MKAFYSTFLVFCWSVSIAVCAFRQQHPARRPPKRRGLPVTGVRKNADDLAYPNPSLPNFCANCGSSNMVVRVPDGDERPRACCSDCDTIVYVNPKVVVATVVFMTEDDESQAKCLLAKRAINPRKGYWGIPQGFQEMGETSREAAAREVYEETGAVVNADQLRFRAVYNVPGSVQLVYQLDCTNDLEIAESTIESTEIGFFALNDLPELCFPTVQWALDHCSKTSQEGSSGIQQKTKTYDPTTNTWGEFEDEAAS